jgi:hypothetical protein
MPPPNALHIACGHRAARNPAMNAAEVERLCDVDPKLCIAVDEGNAMPLHTALEDQGVTLAVIACLVKATVQVAGREKLRAHRTANGKTAVQMAEFLHKRRPEEAIVECLKFHLYDPSKEEFEKREQKTSEHLEQLKEKEEAVRKLRDQTQRAMHSNHQQSHGWRCCQRPRTPTTISDAQRELDGHERKLKSFRRSRSLLEADILSSPKPQADELPSGKYDVVPMADRQYDVFINHCQKSGQDQCKTLAQMLTGAGSRVWYDMQAQDLTAEGMEKAVSQSRHVLMFLSDDLMGRPFCNAEQRWAKLYECHFVGVVEKDIRHGNADFSKEKERAPADLKHLLDDVEFIEYRRRDFEAEAMVQEIVRRTAWPKPSAPRTTTHTAAPEPEPEPEPELEPEPEPEPEIDDRAVAIGPMPQLPNVGPSVLTPGSHERMHINHLLCAQTTTPGIIGMMGGHQKSSAGRVMDDHDRDGNTIPSLKINRGNFELRFD